MANIKTWKTAAYIRLSREDGDRPESESVINQRQIIDDFIISQPDLGEYTEFIDDGATGTNFNRRGFQLRVAANNPDNSYRLAFSRRERERFRDNSSRVDMLPRDDRVCGIYGEDFYFSFYEKRKVTKEKRSKIKLKR